MSAFLVLLVPRARILGEALAQLAVMFAMYHLYCMMIAEGGGPEKLVRWENITIVNFSALSDLFITPNRGVLSDELPHTMIKCG